MAGGRKLLVYSAAIFAVSVACAAYPALEFLTIDKSDPTIKDLSSIGFVLNLWRPVFISTALFGLCLLLISLGRPCEAKALHQALLHTLRRAPRTTARSHRQWITLAEREIAVLA